MSLDWTRLRAWADKSDPDHLDRRHQYDARCPWCSPDAHDLAAKMLDLAKADSKRIDALEADNEAMQARLDNWHDLGDDLAELLERLIADGVTAQPGLPELRRRIREGQGVNE